MSISEHIITKGREVKLGDFTWSCTISVEKKERLQDDQKKSLESLGNRYIASGIRREISLIEKETKILVLVRYDISYGCSREDELLAITSDVEQMVPVILAITE